MPSAWSKTQGSWQQRIARAQELAELYPASRQILKFYEDVLQFQTTISDGEAPRETGTLSNLRSALDLPRAASTMPRLIALVRERGPSKLNAEIAPWSEMPDERVRAVLADWLAGKCEDQAAVTFFARVLLEPQAEALAESMEWQPRVVGNRCPSCGGIAQLAVLRPEGDGGKRMLLCSLCHTEWEFRRVWCPACGEENHEKLPRYTAEAFPSVRVEACDTCRTYLKSVDLTIDGHAVPLVDEVAAAALDLTAADMGYSKILPNIVGF